MATGALGTGDRPLRVAVIGSGPSGFYAAEHLLNHADVVAEVDVFDRLPTPFGLVRGGVAPDHQKIKSVTKMYDKIAAHPRFRFFGNVEIGTDIPVEDLRAYFHAVIYAVGAKSDRRMGIPNEHLPGSHSATDFVGWYNAHPDFRRLRFDLSGTTALVVGNGNVAMDVARILASPTAHLATTDIASHAFEALGKSRIQEVILLGRRGPAQAAFTPKELREFGEMDGVDVIVDADQITLDPLTEAHIAANADRTRDANIGVMREMATRAPTGGRRVRLRFLGSPVEIVGTDRVEAVVVERNALHKAADGQLRPKGTGETETIPVNLVFRAIGYQGVPLPGVPFDDWAGLIPNEQGRVIDPARDREPIVGEYVAGWIKRGPTGVIGTNKPDSVETANAVLQDLADGALQRDVPGADVLAAYVGERCADIITYHDWRTLDGLERAAGEAQGRPRVKFTTVEAMLDALREAETP